MTRIEFQELAEVRLKEAETLLAAGLWDGAYYLAGYAVECGLKACIAKLFKADKFPERSFSDKCYTHDLAKLVELAEIAQARLAEETATPGFALMWSLVLGWKETCRYDRITRSSAEELFEAISAPSTGVMRWIRHCW
jgi:hypothetical protein